MFTVNDALDAILLGAFFFGLIFSIASLVMGVADLGWGHLGHGHDGPGPLNLAVLLAFITWFGGIAYMLRTGAGIPAFFAIFVGIAGGVIGGILVYRLMKAKRSSYTPSDAPVQHRKHLRDSSLALQKAVMVQSLGLYEEGSCMLLSASSKSQGGER